MATADRHGGNGVGHGPGPSSLPELSLLAEHSDQMIVAFDAEFRYNYVNPATEQLIGPRENFLGRVLWEVAPHAVGTNYAEHYHRSMRERVVVEFEEYYAPRDRWNRVLCVPTADGGLVIRARDTTTEHRAKLAREDALQSLRQSEERHRRLVELLPEALYVNHEDRIVLANPAFLRLVGATAESQVLGRSPFEFFHPDNHAAKRERIWRMLETDQPVPAVEETLLRLDGMTVTVEAVAAPFPLDGKTMIQVVLRDVSARKASEAALRGSEEYLRRLIESSPDCIKTLDLEGRLLSMNEGGQRMFGVPDFGAIRGKDWIAFWAEPRTRTQAMGAVAAGRDGGTGRFQGYCPTLRGEPRWWDVVVTPLLGADGRPEQLLAVSRDVTARQESERRREFLAELTERVRALPDPDAVLYEAARLVGEFLGVDRCTFGEVEGAETEADGAITVHRDYVREGVPSIAGMTRPLLSFGRPIIEEMKAGGAGGDGVSAIEDVLADPRVSPEHRAAFAELGIRSLLGAPVHQGGRWVSLLVIHHGEPRPWPAEERALLAAVAERTLLAVDNARLLRSMRREVEERRRVEAELRAAEERQRRIADTLQRSLLITPVPDAGEGLEVYAHYEAASVDAQVGGDAYDFVRLTGGRTGLCVYDVTGHGTDAALFTADIKFSTRNYLRESGGDPAEALRRLNRHVLDGHALDGKPENVFVCAAIAVFDAGTGDLTVAAAGMEPPLLLRAAAGDVEAVAGAAGPILGALEEWNGSPVVTRLDAGDMLLLYTDGLTEARQGKRGADFFGMEGAARAFGLAAGRGAFADVAESIAAEARSFAGGRLGDDLCILAARFKRTPAA